MTIASPAFELMRRFIDRSIRVSAYDPIEQAREEARAAFGGSVDCLDVLTEAWRGAETVLICNKNPEFAGLGAVIPPDRWIIDP
ncbi:MAG TPA: UDP binding domain-containing protein [Methyloceanibacter sp.]|nr:UDP binding domain-containing protein [Methyloceanibacter sp.]